MEKMNVVFNGEYKNETFCVYVEDDVITSSRCFNAEGEVVEENIYCDAEGEEIFYSKKSYDEVIGYIKEGIDKRWEEEFNQYLAERNA